MRHFPLAPRRRAVARRALRRGALLAALLLTPAAPVHAQILRVPRSVEPAVWAGAGIAYVQPRGVINDGRSRSAWDFRDGVRYVASLEWGIRNQSSIGLLGAHGTLPMVYHGDCGRCGARADVWSAMALFHAGGGQGLHQVLEAGIGITGFRNFRADDGSRLAPLAEDRDLSFQVGLGFGYSLGDRAHVTLVQDAGYILHQRDDLPSDADTSLQYYTTRLGLRLGFGHRR